jgi:hypothetical protein
VRCDKRRCAPVATHKATRRGTTDR